MSRITRDDLIYEKGTTLAELAKAKGVVDKSFTLVDDRCPCDDLPEGSYAKNELIFAMIEAYTNERATAVAKNVELKSDIQRITDEMTGLNEIYETPLSEYRHCKRVMNVATEEGTTAMARAEEIAATQLKAFFDRNGELFEAREKLKFELNLVHNTLAEIDESWGIPRYLNLKY